jgi:hypothetical protein
VLAEAFDLAGVGLAFVSMGGDGEHGDGGGGSAEDEDGCLAFGVSAGQS